MSKNSQTLLTSHDYLTGLHCRQLLWYLRHRPEKVQLTENSPSGTVPDAWEEVFRWAKTLYPGGVDVDWDGSGWDAALKLSEIVIRSPQVSYRVGVRYEGCFARTDILIPAARANTWNLLLVKTSTGVKEDHLREAAFQKWVLTHAGMKLGRIQQIHINGDYLRSKEIDPYKLLTKKDITLEIADYFEEVEENVRILQSVLAEPDPPELNVVDDCDGLKGCPLFETCWNFLPPRHVFQLHADSNRKRTYSLLRQGIHALSDIPEDFELTDKQRIQVTTEKTQKPYIDKEAIKSFLNLLEYPVYFLDFETFQSPVPPYIHSRPWENIPFQYSLHRVDSPLGEIHHDMFLATGKEDPRPELLRQLKEKLGKTGSIVAYNAEFETSRLKECATHFPQYRRWVEQIRGRFVDLLEPFKNFHFYHPKQNGSASLKATLPVLTGLRYDTLEISEGGEAGRQLLKLVFHSLPRKEEAKVRKHLEEYCRQDTEGMVYIIRKLMSMAHD